MTASELNRVTGDALSVADVPRWACPNEPSEQEVLVYVSDDDIGPVWAIAAAENADSEYTPIDASLASDIIKGHLQSWLAERGWQVQLSVQRDQSRWRLADCLSVVDGGGDRLDGDYPFGDDEMAVLCDSVLAVERNAVAQVGRTVPVTGR